MTIRSKQLRSVSGMLVSGGLAATSAAMMIVSKTVESLPDGQVMANIGWFALALAGGWDFAGCLGDFVKAARSTPDPAPPFEYRPDDRELPMGTRTDVLRDHREETRT